MLLAKNIYDSDSDNILQDATYHMSEYANS